MKNLLATIFVCLFPLLSFAQNIGAEINFNLDFEKKNPGQKLPDKWMEWGKGYQLSTDSIEKYSGKTSVLIQAPADKANSPFGCAASTIPAIYEGKEIELRGFMKFENVEGGWAGLMLRIDGNSGALQFSNMQADNIHGTQDWKQYSIKLPYPGNAAQINIGALLTGTGKLWIDQFELFIDGKPFATAPTRKPAAAELDKKFAAGSKIDPRQLSPAQVKDIANLGKLWGFLKYYHPAVAGGNHNWDYELFRILPQVINAKNDPEKQKALYDWIAKLGPVKTTQETVSTGKAVLKPNLAWINATTFGKDVASLLDSIKIAKRPDEHYYIGLFPGVGNPDFKNENAYTQMSFPDAGYRLLCLFRYWNMIEYYFPYKALIKEDWHAVLAEFVPKFFQAATEIDYKLATLALIARVKDTHANIYNQDPALNKYFGKNFAPLQLTFVEGKPVVTDYYNTLLGEQSGLKKGDVIETVNGKKIEDIVKEKLPYTPASNYTTQLKNMTSNILRSNDSTIAVSFKRNGKIEQKSIPVFGPDKINIYANYNKKDTCFKLIEPDVAYVFPGKFKNTYLPRILPEISKAKSLIIDMRCYPSDFMVFTFGEFILPEAKPFVKFSAGSVQTPGLFTMTPELKVGKNNPDYFKGKIVIIVNEITLSQAEYTTMALSTAPNVTIIGSTTAAADGNVSQIVLPGGIRTGISGIGVYYPDGKETQQVGIVPKIEAKPTIEGIVQGRDEVLEKALLEVKKK